MSFPEPMTAEFAKSLTVAELRRAAVQRKIGTPDWRSNARRADLEMYLGLSNQEIRDMEPSWEVVKAVPQESDDLAGAIARALEGRIKTQAQDPETAERLDGVEERLEALDGMFKRAEQSIGASAESVKAEVGAFIEAKFAEAKEGIAKDLEAVIRDIAGSQAPRTLRIEVQTAARTGQVEGFFHRKFQILLGMVAAHQHVYLVGDAGSGKTKAAELAAQALGLEFFPQSVGAQTTMAHLMGFIDAAGNLHKTAFRRAYEDGGVFILDEIDAGNANVLTALNAALANGHCSFPDGTVERHADFICIAAANTIGHGADRQYVGRNQLDAATLDRFVYLPWPTDWELTRALVGVCPSPAQEDPATFGPQLNDPAEWCRFVENCQAACSALKIRHVVSPRAILSGCALARQNFGRDLIAQACVYKGLDQQNVDRIESWIVQHGHN